MSVSSSQAIFRGAQFGALFAVESIYGGPDASKRFVRGASRGIDVTCPCFAEGGFNYLAL
jgi:hypothetical protein